MTERTSWAVYRLETGDLVKTVSCHPVQIDRNCRDGCSVLPCEPNINVDLWRVVDHAIVPKA